MANREMTMEEIEAKRKEVTRDVIGGLVKCCVGTFFGAVAAHIIGGTNAPKIEKYMVIGGGLLLGAYAGEQTTNYIYTGYENFADKWKKIQENGGTANG